MSLTILQRQKWKTWTKNKQIRGDDAVYVYIKNSIIVTIKQIITWNQDFFVVVQIFCFN